MKSGSNTVYPYPKKLKLMLRMQSIKQPNENSERGKYLIIYFSFRFIRKGQVGGWKSELAPELSKRFDEWTMEKVKDDSLRKLFLNDI